MFCGKIYKIIYKMDNILHCYQKLNMKSMKKFQLWEMGEYLIYYYYFYFYLFNNIDNLRVGNSKDLTKKSIKSSTNETNSL